MLRAPRKQRNLQVGFRSTQHAKASTSVSVLKKKVRDLERLLLHTNSRLSADARIENERALEAFRLELSDANQSKTEQKMAKKYHMVRFFERQKATRKLNKLKKELNTHRRNVPDDLTRSVEDAQVELNYTLHYPRGEKYISLFKNPGNNNNVAEKRDMIKQDIKHRIEQGTLGAPTTGGDDTQQYISQSARYCKDKTKTGEEKKERTSDQTGGNIEEDDFFEF